MPSNAEPLQAEEPEKSVRSVKAHGSCTRCCRREKPDYKPHRTVPLCRAGRGYQTAITAADLQQPRHADAPYLYQLIPEGKVKESVSQEQFRRVYDAAKKFAAKPEAGW